MSNSLDNDDKYKSKMIDEMEAVAIMIRRAENQGLLLEVVKSALESQATSIEVKCVSALYEWDC